MINVEYMNKIDFTYINNGSSTMEIPELSYFDGDQYDLYDPKDYARFIQDTERVVRMSYEYRQLIGFLRTTEGMNRCSFLGNVTNVDNTKVKIEIHHSPLTLFDIAATVIKKRLHNQECIDIFECAREVMWLHYMGFVGLLPLSETVHEMVHNQYIFVPTNIVRGNYRAFIDMYYNYIDPEILDAVDNAERMTQEWLSSPEGMHPIATQMDIFNLHATYLRIRNINPVDMIPSGRDDIKNRITEIKSNKKVLYRLVKKVG